MRFTIFLLLFAFTYVQCKNNVKALTESMGQEIIEMGAIKELPPGLDEEPSANFDDEENGTSTTLQSATKREMRKATTTSLNATTPTKGDEATTEDVLSQEEEEGRIEKELSEIYKDTDYKSEPNKEVLKVVEKNVVRARTNFKFQPDVNDRADVERFRTSIDEISCEKRVTTQLHEEIRNSATVQLATNFVVLSLTFLAGSVCQ